MNREKIRQMLQQRFDEGQPLTKGLEPHLERPSESRSYLRRLEELQDVLMDIPLEEPSPDLAERIQRNVHVIGLLRFRRIIGTAATALVVITVILGWQFPVTVDIRSWATRLEPWLPKLDWNVITSFLASQLHTAWRDTTSLLGRNIVLSLPALLIGICLMILFLAVFNGFEAARLRSALASGASGRHRGSFLARSNRE